MEEGELLADLSAQEQAWCPWPADPSGTKRAILGRFEGLAGFYGLLLTALSGGSAEVREGVLRVRFKVAPDLRRQLVLLAPEAFLVE